MHKVEREMKADHEKPEVPLPESLAHHSARHLGEPVIKRREDTEEDSAHNYIVEVLSLIHI